MAKKVKMADIAAALKVSTVTVSKALSDQKGVSEELRKRIKQLADEMGYQQPYTSKSARREQSYNIGVLVPEKYFGKYDSFYWQMYQEVARQAVSRDCFTMLEVISVEEESGAELPKLIRENKVDGAILIGKPDGGYLRSVTGDSKIPLICMDFFDESCHCDGVISDGYYGTYMLTNYLFDMGHEDIAYVGTLLYTGSITDRYFGYCKSMLEHGKEVPPDYCMDDRDMETGIVRGFDFQLPEHMPTAFVCNSDLTASSLIRTLRERGYRVPEDISLVGFDNYLYPGSCDIGITTYEVDVANMAVESIGLLVNKISGESYKSGVHIVEGHIVYKDSVRHRA